VANILIANGWQAPFKTVPSPADFEKVLEAV
jgi:nitrogen fixation protein